MLKKRFNTLKKQYRVVRFVNKVEFKFYKNNDKSQRLEYVIPLRILERFQVKTCLNFPNLFMDREFYPYIKSVCLSTLSEPMF